MTHRRECRVLRTLSSFARMTGRSFATLGFALAVATPALAAVGINKSFSPNSVVAGQVSQLTIVLLNPNATAATGVSFADNLPANVVVANPAVGSTTCGAGVVTATSGTGSVSLAGGTIAAASGTPGTCTVTVNVVSTVPSTYLNLIPANAVTSSNGTNAQAAQATLVVSALASATGSKVFSPNVVHGNGATETSVSTLTITLNNPNVVPLTGAAITDSLPALLTVATPANATTTCAGGTATASTPATNPATVTLSGGTIPASGSCTITVSVIARNPAAVQNGNVTNTIPAGALTTAEGATTISPINAAINVQTGGRLTKAFVPTGPIPVGGSSLLRITVSNYNQTTLAPITFTDSLPAGLALNGAPTTTCDGTLSSVAGPPATVTLTGASLGPAPAAAGATTCIVEVPVTPTTSGTKTNNIAGGTWGGIAYGGTGNVNLTVSNITGSKSFSPTPVLQGGTTTLTITLNNTTPAAIAINSPTGVTEPLTSMGAGFSVPAGATVGGTCGSSLTSALPATTLVFGGGTIPANGSCTITIGPVAVAANAVVGNRTNTIAVNGVQTSAGNNTVTITGVLAVTALISASKAWTPTTIVAGARARLTITVSRPANGSALSNISFTDNLGTMGGLGFVIADPANEATTCTGGTVTAAPGASSFSLAGGSLAGGAAASSCTVAVDVQSQAGEVPANYTNTLAAGAITTTEGFTNAVAATSALSITGPKSVTVNKSFSPTTVPVGGTSTMSIQIRNNNPGAIALTGVGLTDLLPLRMDVANPPAPTFTNCGSPTVTAVNGSGIVTISGASIGANAICTVNVGVRASAAGNLINTIAPGGVTSLQGVTNPLLGSATLAATGTVNLNVTKTNNVSSLVPGGATTYVIVVTNAGPDDIAGLGVNDDPPTGVTFGAWTCVGSGGGVCSANGSGPIADLVAIPVGGQLTYTVPATIAVDAPGPIVQTVTLGVPGSVINTGNSSATDTDPLVPTLAKQIAPPTIGLGGAATLTLVLGNNNSTPQTLASAFVDNMPAGVTTTTGNTGTCTAVTVTSTSITMASGASIPAGGCTIVVGITSSTPGTVTNTTGALATDVGTAPPASAPITVTAVAPTLAKSISPTTIGVGGTASLTLTLGNANAGAITLSSAFIDPMPAGVTTTGANSGTCTGVTVTSTSLTMAAGTTIPAGGCTIVVPITSSTPGSVINTTGALATNAGTAPAASAPLTVTAIAPTLGKAIAPATINAGGTATLTLTLGNPNPIAISLTSAFTDPMPAGVTTTGANSGTCTGITVAADSVTMASGTSIPPGGCTIVVPITSTTPGMVTNTTGTLATGAGSAPPASAPLTVNAAPTLTKAIGPASIGIGGSATLTLTLGNANAGPLTLQSAFTDTMPAGVTITGANTGTCPGVTNTTTDLTMASGAQIPAGGCTIVVPVTSSTPGSVTNTTGPLVTESGTAPPASAPLEVTANAAALLKTIVAATIPSGGTATMTLTLGNGNAVPITLSAPFTDTMPAGVTTTSANTGTCVDVTVTPTTVTMASGASIPVGGCSIVVTLTSTTVGTVTNTTSELQTNAGVTPPASAPLTVTASTAGLTKTIVPAAIASGGTATLTIALANTSGDPLTLTAAFVDTMPAGVTTTSANTGTCTGVTVTPTSITMASGSTVPVGGCEIVVTITSTTVGTVTNTTGTLTTTGGSAPPASAPITVNAAPTLGKAIAPASIAAGDTATLTLTLGNSNPLPLMLTAPFTDAMPAGVTTTSGNAGTCSGVTVTATTITMASGTPIPVGGCTIVVTITSSTNGTVTNTTGTLTTEAGTAPPASAPLTVTGGSGVASLMKTFAPAAILAGGSSTLTITLGNAGGGPLLLTAPFTDPMPAGITITSPQNGTCAGVMTSPTLITMDVGTSVPPGGCTIVVSVTSSAPGTMTNVTSPLVAGSVTAPAATAPLGVIVTGPTEPIPATSPFLLALMMLCVGLLCVPYLRRR